MLDNKSLLMQADRELTCAGSTEQDNSCRHQTAETRALKAIWAGQARGSSQPHAACGVAPEDNGHANSCLCFLHCCQAALKDSKRPQAGQSALKDLVSIWLQAILLIC